MIDPDKALEALKQGNRRFLDGTQLKRDFLNQVKQTSGAQSPFAVVLSCMDSRVPSEIVFDQGIGDIFVIRVAGNVINEDVLGGLEYACKVIGARLIIVLGHTGCGAIKAACDDVKLGNITKLVEKITPAVEKTQTNGERNSQNNEFVNGVSENNVNLQIEKIIQSSNILSEMIVKDEIGIIGAMYDVESGKVTFQIK